MREKGKDIFLQVCNKCILPETFPGIHFDSEGVCNFCSTKGVEQSYRKERSRLNYKFGTLIKEKKGKGCYDALMCFSGGKTVLTH